MRNILIEQAQFLVETDQMEPLEYIKVLKEINSISEEDLFVSAVEDLETALNEGEITDEEFDLMLDEYVQDIGDESGMQEDYDIDEDYELDESIAGAMANSLARVPASAALNAQRSQNLVKAMHFGRSAKAVGYKIGTGIAKVRNIANKKIF